MKLLRKVVTLRILSCFFHILGENFSRCELIEQALIFTKSRNKAAAEIRNIHEYSRCSTIAKTLQDQLLPLVSWTNFYKNTPL